MCFIFQKEIQIPRQAGLVPARPGCRPGGDPRPPAFGRPWLGNQAGWVPKAAGLVPAQAETRPGTCPSHPALGRTGRGPGRRTVTAGSGGDARLPAAEEGEGEREGARVDAELTRKRGEGRGGMEETAAAESMARPAAGVERKRLDSSSRRLPSLAPSAIRERSSRRSLLSASICAGRT